ncbi:FAD-dependent oxidoreductase [Chitinophaga sp. SYP-B3965]|uniref:FAD-dependent oxidoreductase n=1 Tax=Chitinophaga sp. SYP-B3965 TaxID=2663120 RepID=UPI001299691C|nr:FAD-dependent oxidoreductase [Chitinophaga sp. SYP-B3965]MRG44816.1 FAD-dependent oxidoreductase [Chitinophaga sp. SYP-B3965]
MKKITILFILVAGSIIAKAQQAYDICIYGGTSGGVIAAYTAKKMGKSVLLIEPGKHLGGLTSGGLGYTDIGNKYAVTGLAIDFYRRLGKYYGHFESWIFEPHVAEDLFMEYIHAAKIEVLYQNRILSAKKENGYIKEIVMESGKTIRAKVFIDCSYEGDLMAKAGVSYMVGREASDVYNESYNGVQVQPSQTPQRGNQVPDGVDPYKVPGHPESGLLWGISNAPLPAIGSGNKHVQAYNFRICLTNDPTNRIPITRPEKYDSSRYELLPRYIAKLTTQNDIREILKFDLMPNHKTDINNGGGFSTDMIGMNWNYPDGSYAVRDSIQKEHELYNKGLLYFIGHDPRIPDSIRLFMLDWGYPKDEYKDNGHWSPQMYVREARRMIGAYVMTQANCERKEVVTDGIGMAAYGMDSHNTQRLVINGMVKNEGDVERGGVGPYPIAYRALTPKAAECKNLLVPVCLSASHIGFGSIRMEPVFMVLGQSAATAAVLAIEKGTTVQEVDVKKLQALLKTDPLVNGRTPEILVDNEDSLHLKIKGNWAFRKGGFYGPTAYLSAVNDQPKSVQFIPEISKGGAYDVYTYVLPRLSNISSVITCSIFNGKEEKEVIIKKSAIDVKGQTSGEWVHLGRHQLPAGKSAYVAITNKGADGVVAADAVLLVPHNF